MKFKPQIFILLIGLLIILLSCKGQSKIANEDLPITPFKLNQKITNLDTYTWNIFQDRKGNYWFGTNGSGVYFYDNKDIIVFTQKDGLIDNTIRGIQGDHLGNIFIETPEGVSKYDGKTFTTLEPISSPKNQWKLESTDLWFKCNGNPNHVYRYNGISLFELPLPEKNLKEAFGTEVSGLSFIDMNSSPYSVYGLDKDKEGNLWIGTIVAGAFRFDGKSFLWIPERELTTLPDGRVPGVRSILEDKNGYFWLSNFISKYKIEGNNRNVTYSKLKGIDVTNGKWKDRLPYFNSGLSDKYGDLWMTTYTGGVWKYDGNKLTNFPVYDGDTEVLLISIYEDNEGVLWLGTNNAGAYKFNGKSFEKFVPTIH